LKIVVDENIPDATTVFARFGQVVTMPGRKIDRDAVRDADAVIVRSITRVNRALLEGSTVRFVGSATAGVDHIAQDDLDALNIQFAHAPGSNADSVVDYVLAALALRYRGAAWLDGHRVGVVGCGNVGGRLLQRLRAMGIPCCGYDPLLSVDGLVSFDEVLSCDVISLHVPLTQAGQWPTYHRFSAAELQQLPTHCLLINAARGPVVDNGALLDWLRQTESAAAVLDTWEFEPRVDDELMQRCLIGTPHVAGYALDGKFRGVDMVVASLASALGAKGEGQPVRLPGAGVIEASTLSAGVAWQEACLRAYDIQQDDQDLRSALAVAKDEPRRTDAFDRLRKHYPNRREFSAWTVECEGIKSDELKQLAAAGFQQNTLVSG